MSGDLERKRPGIVAWAMLAAFAFTLTFGAVHNDFPDSYHPDEPSKVAQVLTGERNYHHPPLMLALTLRVMRTAGIARQEQNVARTGRFLSTLYLAAAAALLTWLAGVYGGPGGAVCAAAALGTNAQAALAGHFFKEDALFAFGLALTFCAGAVHWRRRGVDSLLALGAAAGLAVSSKYVGVLMVAYALVLAACAAKPGARWRAVGIGALGAAAVLLVCNGGEMVGKSADWRRGLAYGLAVAQEGNHAVGARVPHLRFVGMFFLFTPLPVLAGAAAFWAGLKHYSFHAHADRWLVGLAPLWMLVLFSFSASTAIRYFLPISLELDAVAGAALPGLARWALARMRPGRPFPGRVSTLMAVVVVVAFNLPRLCSLLGGFAGDNRAELHRWIAGHLPPSAVIAQDALAQLPGGVPLPQRVLSRTSVADFGDLAALRAQGITHVVVCWYDSRRFVDSSKQPAAGAAADFARRRAFYLALPTHARRLWGSELRQPYPLCPGLELFALDEK